MRINYNVSAMLTNNALANNDNMLSQSLQRLSSGLKVNRAKDNPAGLAMAKRMNAQLRGLSAATNNAGDGVSVIEIADGAMSEISEMLQRMNELSVKAANGVLSSSDESAAGKDILGDRELIQNEIAQLKDEITRVAKTVEFNGQKLLNGEYALRGYTDNLNVKVSSYSMNVTAKEYTIEQIVIQEDTALGGAEKGKYKASVAFDLSGGYGNFPQNTTASLKDNRLVIEAPNGFEMTLDLTDVDFQGELAKLPAGSTYTVPNPNGGTRTIIDATGIGCMRLQVGANEGQVLEMDIPRISLRDMGIEDLDVSTEESATAAIDLIEGAMQFISSVRGRLGAYQNRLESTINSLDVTSENMTAAYSRIMDVDMAEEMTQYTTAQVMTQAATSMLAQANERPSQVLQLLQ